MTVTPRRLSPVFWLLLAGAVVVALLPWWRNHAYLRDLYDYGVVLKANARLAAGERPYVDFKSPMQAGFLGLNSLIERVGGGTYAGLTRGGAGLIVVSVIGLALLLVRRWPAWAAVILAGAVAVSGASQHTILVHNAVGLLCLAVATWSLACAPVVRRETWPWHVAAAVALFVGGANKVNFQAVSLVVSMAWALRAGLLGQAAWGRVGATVAGIVVAGTVLPIAAELAWTGATLRQWLESVVLLAASNRGGLVWDIFSRRFLLEPIHDYYGTQALRPVGLAGLGLSLAALAGCGWRARARVDRALLVAAVLLTGAAAAALSVTNVEIASVGLGAWLVLACSLWLGFGTEARRAAWVAGLVLPALVLGGAAWWNAWQGLRSQFGFSKAPRSEYVAAEKIGPAFASWRGLRLPPDVALSLELLERTLPPADAEGRRPVFYGPGLELLDRYYPAVRDRQQPLWIHWGTSYGPAEVARLNAALAAGRPYEAVLVTVGFENWPDSVLNVLKEHYTPELVGGAIRRWTWRAPETVDRGNSLDVLAKLGGNLDGRILHLDRRPFAFRQIPDGRVVFGTTWPEGNARLMVPVNRFRGVAVVARLPGAGEGAVTVSFRAVVHGASPENVRWAGNVELPAGQAAVSVPFEVDASGQSILLLTQRSDQVTGVFAGYRELEITHAIEAPGAPVLLPSVPAETPPSPEMAASLLDSVAWRPQQMVVRGGRPGDGGLELPAGSELWLHTDNMAGEIRGRLQAAASGGAPALVRVMWYKGGRLQMLEQSWVSPGQPVDFRAWTAEPGGWIGLLVAPGEGKTSVIARATGTTLAP